MKRRVAVFANGWSDEYLKNAMEGVQKCAKEKNVDILLFIEYASTTDDVDYAQGDVNILNLPDLDRFDGFILFGNTLNNRGELSILKERILKTNKPAVCLEYELDGMDCICTDNYSGMRELCEHIIGDHNARDIVFISGDEENLENIDRKRALTDVLAEYGETLKDENVIVGGWSYYNVRQLIPEFLRKHKLPDAFVCANDVMAMGTIYALNLLGYSVPSDVIVTGFDNIISAQTYNPIITTVDRGWQIRSIEGLNHLIDLMDGAPRKGIMKKASRLFKGESCGCSVSAELKQHQAEFINNAYAVPVERTMFDWHLQAIDTVANDVCSMEEVSERFANLFDETSEIGYRMYEGDTFCICLDESFVDSIVGANAPRCFGYGDRMDVIFAMRGGKILPRQSIVTSYIYPVFDTPDEPSNIYMVAPLHNNGSVIGYAVFKNQYKMINMYYLNTWLAHLSKAIVRAKQCIEVDYMTKKINEMSLRDELSGLLNRKGYEKRAIPFLEQIRADGKSGVLMVVDINKMKMINDVYGHLQGDLAIRLVSKSIMATIPSSWYGVRYGGDEFVIIGENVFFDDGYALQNTLCDVVKKQAEDLMLPFKLSISIGTVIIDPNENVTLDEYFKKADATMYEMKKKLHAQREDKN
ncbi:MAG: GGDEF domain-containing protein [Clostridia bacterium]|nr:GGDEF domain-containing protein [Clostridia bacterium]